MRKELGICALLYSVAAANTIISTSVIAQDSVDVVPSIMLLLGDEETTQTSDAYYYGDYALNNRFDVGFFNAVTNVAQTLSLTGLDGLDVNAIAPSSDGKLLAVAGHDMSKTSDQIFLYDVTDFTSPPILFNIPNFFHSVEISQIVFSPDGSKIAYISDRRTNGKDRIHIARFSDKESNELRLFPPEGGDVKHIQWSLDSRYVVFSGDALVNNVNGIWSVDTRDITPKAVEIVPASSLSTTAQVNVEHSPYFGADGKVYFSAFLENSLTQLFRANIDGSELEQVPGTIIMTDGTTESDIVTWSMSPSGEKLVFSAFPTANLAQVYVTDLAGNTSAITNIQLPVTGTFTGNYGPSIAHQPHWNSDETSVAILADWLVMDGEADNDFTLWVADVESTDATRLVAPPQGTSPMSLDVNKAMFSGDGERIYFSGDIITNGLVDLYVTDDFETADQSSALLRIVTSVTRGDIFDFTVTP